MSLPGRESVESLRASDFCVMPATNPDNTLRENVYYICRDIGTDTVPLVRVAMISNSIDDWMVQPVGSSDFEPVSGAIPARERALVLAGIELRRRVAR